MNETGLGIEQVEFLGRKYKDLDSLCSSGRVNKKTVDLLRNQGFGWQESIKVIIGYYLQLSYKQGNLIFKGVEYSSLDMLLDSNGWELAYFTKMLENTPMPVYRQLKKGYIYKDRIYWKKDSLLTTLKITAREFDSLNKAFFLAELDNLKASRKKKVRKKK